MMALPKRRRVTPVNYAQQIISAIISIRQQKQVPNFERISRCLQRFSDITPSIIKDHLNSAVSDGLIVEYITVGNKGEHRVQLEQEGYKILPIEKVELEVDGHDWYCFNCHNPGDVYECSDCFRVYHHECTSETTTKEIFTCSVCKASRQKSRMKKKLLNTLLSFTILHLKAKARDLYKICSEIPTDDLRRFVYKKMDIRLMERKVQASRYRCMEEFQSDVQTILHNCALVFGEENRMTELALVMMRDCKYNLDEIELCPTCFYMSNTRLDGWFSQPCDPPHELVYAKQKGYSYWPAKVVKDLNGRYDVRFFGGGHERAVIPANFVKPICTDINTLMIKKTAGFQKALIELNRHQEILKKTEQTTTIDDSEEEAESEKDKNKKVQSENMTFEEDNVENMKEKMSIKVKTRKNSDTLSRTTMKRKRKATNNREYELEDEVANKQIIHTSVNELSKKHMRKSSKNSSHDESNNVTSSVDEVSYSSPHIVTISAAVQTSCLQTESVFTQTDVRSDSTQIEETGSDLPKTVTGYELQLNATIWEERMATAMTKLTKSLKKRFEEDKKIAFMELSQQLQEDFGKDKQQAVERTLANMKLEIEKARKAGEDKTREQYMEEMKKLATSHMEDISQVKKKQWRSNFGTEFAIHH